MYHRLAGPHGWLWSARKREAGPSATIAGPGEVQRRQERCAYGAPHPSQPQSTFHGLEK
eukprot:CAMPEP_0203952398 /NCGR_PEP_ID=MMETSP0359-20131031/86056_1 /ASSEMBLY_ACC=CAM_ASM_000338 /TAXON_ID=268821 /ORGANISM="Scrippsiella Hangoei, Strain SHTV-5" /LENGTH=58 /DNA_ID=CAMNT_0050885381 /DNA_START=1 /DNA_END=174 /DNA_ORIENTATION=+